MNTISVNEVIEMAVQIEKSGYSFYERALQRTDLSGGAKKLITLLRDEEIKHEEIFKALRNQVDELELDESADWDMVTSYMQAIVESRIFNTPDSAIHLAGMARDEMDIISNAIEFEKDTLLYFHSVGMSISNEKTKKILAAIIEEETKHIIKLNNFKREIS